MYKDMFKKFTWGWDRGATHLGPICHGVGMDDGGRCHGGWLSGSSKVYRKIIIRYIHIKKKKLQLSPSAGPTIPLLSSRRWVCTGDVVEMRRLNE